MPSAAAAPVQAPSPWVTRWSGLLPAGGRVLDLAAGAGRHARWLAAQGFEVEAVDRDSAALDALRLAEPAVRVRVADLEGDGWPYADGSFAGIVVCRYLYRPRLEYLAHMLEIGGLLIYETFMLGNEAFGRPRNPDFLLRPGELRDVFAPHLDILAFEEGVFDQPAPAALQRICARRPG
jgi:SAM-dependent methyltransferase